jgi:hypothetical protein
MGHKEEREHQVIASFIQYASNSGISLSMVENPDQIPESLRTFKTLTTDALIKLNTGPTSSYLALDVMALALPMENLIYTILAEKTENILVEYGVALKFRSYKFIEMSMLNEVFKFICGEIKANPLGGTAKLDDRLDLAWKIDVDVEAENRFQLDLGILKHGDGPLWEQIRNENFKPLNKKAGTDGQASKAQTEGIPYILLLDCTGNGQIQQGTHFLSQFPQTYSQGILAALGENISRVAAIYLFTKSEMWDLLYISDQLGKSFQFENYPKN